jgi:uroporphyrinogen III methyltransferase / synthase
MALAQACLIGVGPDRDKNMNQPRILFTGTDPINFRALGNIVHFPAIHIEKEPAGYGQLATIIDQLKRNAFGHVVFTGKVSAQCFLEALDAERIDLAMLAKTTIIATGVGTAELLAENGVIAEITPADIKSRGVEAVTESLPAGDVLILHSGTDSETRASELAERLGTVTHLSLHRTGPSPDLGQQLPQHDVVYFTTSSAVTAYYDAYGKAGFEKDIWCLGDVALKRVRELGFDGRVVTPHSC